jgi:hypothetical protein
MAEAGLEIRDPNSAHDQIVAINGHIVKSQVGAGGDQVVGRRR